MNIRSALDAARRFLGLGYDGAEQNRHRDNLRYGRSQPQSEDKLLGSWDRIRLRQHCLNLRRNDPYVNAIVDRFCDYVVGQGIMPQAQTTDPEFNQEAEDFWAEWIKVADVRQRSTFRDLQRMTVENRLVSGDCGYVLTKGGQLQPIEGERIATPHDGVLDQTGDIVDGVKVDRTTGIMTAFYVFDRTKDGTIDTNSKNYERVPRENMIYCGAPFRFDQVRAVPELAPVLNTLRDVSELCEATLEKARLDAMHGWAVYSDSPMGPGNMGPRGSSGVTPGSTQFERFERGQNYYLGRGEKLESLASNTPGAHYVEHVKFTLRAVGGALGLPYEFLLMDFSEGNYSVSRTALLITYKTFRDWQTWLINTLIARTWNWRIAKAIKEKVIRPAPLDKRGVSQWYRVDWIPPAFGWADPQRETNSQIAEWNMGLYTLTEGAKERGRDPEALLREKGSDIAMAAMIADETNARQPGLKLTWRDFIGITTQPGSAGAPKQDDDEPKPEPKKTTKGGNP